MKKTPSILAVRRKIRVSLTGDVNAWRRRLVVLAPKRKEAA
jgi:hypothetical protein